MTRLDLTFPDKHIAEIRLNGPEILNALDETTFAQLQARLAEIIAEGDIRCVVMTAEGRAFCAGANYKRHATSERTMHEKRVYLDTLLSGCANLRKFPIPIVAAIQGYAVGIGLELALNCDFIVIAEDAKIGFPEVGISTFVGGGVTHTLPKLVGLAKAREMVMLGTRLSGTEALAAGIANRCVRADELREAAFSLASTITRQAPIPAGFAKQLIGNDLHLPAAELAERDAILACMMTEDWKEGVKAFAEKRAPFYSGR